jgi:integrase
LASIRPKGKGFEVRVMQAGRSVSRTFNTLEEAKRWGTGVELGFVTLAQKGRTKTFVPTLAEVCERYETDVTLHHKGARQEINRLRALRSTSMALMPMTKIDAGAVREFRDDMSQRGLGGGSIRWNLSLLSSLFRFSCEEMGVEVENPVSKIKKPKPGRPRLRRLSEGEESDLMDSLAKCRNGEVLRVIRFLLETGMRKSEALGLTWSQIDLERRLILLGETKSGSPRWIPVTSAIRELLGFPVEPSKKVFAISESALNQAWSHAIKRARIGDLRIHDLRHEALSRWAHRLGGDVFKLAIVSGHKTLQMAQRYVHPVQSELLATLGPSIDT